LLNLAEYLARRAGIVLEETGQKDNDNKKYMTSSMPSTKKLHYIIIEI